RHTRSKRDWSSDVCSSDLVQKLNWIGSPDRNTTLLYIRADTPYISMDDVIKAKVPPKCGGSGRDSSSLIFALEDLIGARFEVVRSEKRRVGKECRSWWWEC